MKALQSELNLLNGEAKEKRLRLLAMVEGDRSEGLSAPPPQVGTPAYLQQQLWLVEQATGAEKKYEDSLRSLLSQVRPQSTPRPRPCRSRPSALTLRIPAAQAVTDERAQEREQLLIEGELKTVSRELRAVKDRGRQIGRLHSRTREQLENLRQQNAEAERQRDSQLGELGAVRSTVLEQQLRMQERRKRRETFKAEAAGDLDDEGEAALVDQLEENKLKATVARQEALQAASQERCAPRCRCRCSRRQSPETQTVVVPQGLAGEVDALG